MSEPHTACCEAVCTAWHPDWGTAIRDDLLTWIAEHEDPAQAEAAALTTIALLKAQSPVPHLDNARAQLRLLFDEQSKAVHASVAATEEHWTSWDDVIAADISPISAFTADAVVARQLALTWLQPYIDRARPAEPRVPTWAFELVRSLVERGYITASGRDVLRWCEEGDPVARSQAVLSCFDLDENKSRVAQLVYGVEAVAVMTEAVGRLRGIT